MMIKTEIIEVASINLVIERIIRYLHINPAIGGYFQQLGRGVDNTEKFCSIDRIILVIFSDKPSHNDRHKIHKHPPFPPHPGLDGVADPKVPLNAETEEIKNGRLSSLKNSSENFFQLIEFLVRPEVITNHTLHYTTSF